MGNRIGGGARRRPVEDRLTRPQRLVRQPDDVDYNKLRKLILARKLAPCFDALDEPCLRDDLEECPICFLYFPSLNQSRCCSKCICTECFLQMKPSVADHPVQCPFCKASYYAVEYRGARTEEEKSQEKAEEQKVIKAKLKMQCESQNMEKVMPSGHFSSIAGATHAKEMSDLGRSLIQENHLSRSCSRQDHNSGNDNLRVNLEEIMIMEAIWDSFQVKDSSANILPRTSDSDKIHGSCSHQLKRSLSLVECLANSLALDSDEE
ncbi:E3 ubiquitin-protein ligase GW2-like [Curcuma longa]|uniref:E3 ubiquitin-protein ligase GW2-like n=1 Tax=Curcuma longa TaxID=136217 RepID=UPI003D9FAD19